MYQVVDIYQAVAQYFREQDRYNSALLRQSWPVEIYNKRVKQQICVIKTGKKTGHHEREKQDVGGEWLGGHHCDSHV